MGKPRLYLFDDSFSALDYATDVRLRMALRPLLQDAAMLLVGQRDASLMHADLIVVLDGGAVIGHGTHTNLPAQNCAYHEIVASRQAREVLL